MVVVRHPILISHHTHPCEAVELVVSLSSFKRAAIIHLEVDLTVRVGMISCLGQDHIWPSDNLWRHLAWLGMLIPQTVH